MVILASPKTVAHALKLIFVVITTLMRWQSLLSSWTSNAPPEALNGRSPGSSRSTRLRKRSGGSFSRGGQIEAGQAFGNLPNLTPSLFLLGGVDQFDGGEEPDLVAVMFYGLDPEGCRDVCLAGARAPDQDDIPSAIEERAAVQRPDGGLVDRPGREVEACEIFVGRAPSMGRHWFKADGGGAAFM